METDNGEYQAECVKQYNDYYTNEATRNILPSEAVHLGLISDKTAQDIVVGRLLVQRGQVLEP